MLGWLALGVVVVAAAMKGLGTTVLIVVRALPADQPHTGLVFTHTHDILVPFSILQSLSLLSCALCLARRSRIVSCKAPPGSCSDTFCTFDYDIADCSLDCQDG
jgi:hypothetical protein